MLVAATEAANLNLPRSQRLKIPTNLPNLVVALVIAELEPVCCIPCGKGCEESDLDLIGVYQNDGPDEGTYSTTDQALRRVIRQYNKTITRSDVDEIRVMLHDYARKKPRCMDRDLIPVNNGIFDYKNKKLLPFDKDKVFLHKCKVNYNPLAQNDIIHSPDDGSDWDVESWVAGLSNDPEIVNLIWESLGAIIRPYVRWNKSVWLYSTCGNSGKGCICTLARNLVGEGNYASLTLKEFAGRFNLGQLIGVSAIINDENDVGTYVDSAASLKAVITNDVISIERKYKQPIPYQFFGFMIQCLNEFPRFRDRSNSFYRRQLFVEFDKCYTGAEKPIIKDDYLSRPEVLEYVLYKVLNMNYYQLSEPAACRELLEDLKESNDPVRQFMNEFSDQFVWDLLPFTFLYDLYKEWFHRVNPGGAILSRPAFIRELIDIVKDHPVWMCKGKKHQEAPKHMMDAPELLIAKYGLKDWMNPNYKGPDLNNTCYTALSTSYRGLLRRSFVAGGITN